MVFPLPSLKFHPEHGVTLRVYVRCKGGAVASATVIVTEVAGKVVDSIPDELIDHPGVVVDQA